MFKIKKIENVHKTVSLRAWPCHCEPKICHCEPKVKQSSDFKSRWIASPSVRNDKFSVCNDKFSVRNDKFSVRNDNMTQFTKYFQKIKYVLSLSTIIFSSTSYSTVFQLLPGESIIIGNTLNQPISAYCSITAVSNVVNTLAIYVIKGNGTFNRTSASAGQTLYQNISNTQYIPISGSANVAAKFTNVSTFAFKADCDLVA